MIYDELWWDDNLKEAIKCYKKVLKLNTEDADAWYNMWVCYLKLNDYKNFIKCRDECKKLNQKLENKIESNEYYIKYKEMYDFK